MRDLNIAICQWDLAWHDPEANRKRVELFLDELKQKADLVILPEMFTTGFTMQPEAVAEKFEGETLDWLTEMAESYQTTLMGSWVVKEEGKYWNRLAAVSPEEVLVEYNKRHLFRMAGENQHYKHGKEWVCFEHLGWRICPQICYDLRFPVWSRNRSMEQEETLMYDVLVYVANWPEARIHHWDALLKARAIENQAFVVGVNRMGKDVNGYVYPGHSTVIDPTGKVLTLMENTEGIQSIVLNRELMDTYRVKFPVWKDADKFDLYL